MATTYTFDTDLLLKGSYKNKGEIDNILFSSGEIVTDTNKTHTGKGIAGSDTSATIPVSSLGFAGKVTELWIRFDAYFGSVASDTLYFFLQGDKNANNGCAQNCAIALYNNYPQANTITAPLSSGFYSIRIHIATDRYELCVDDDLKASSDFYSNQDYFTGITYHIPADAVISNIIISNYDNADETMAELTPFNGIFDTDLLIKRAFLKTFATVRNIPYNMDNVGNNQGLQSISLSISEMQTTDTASFVVANMDIPLLQAINGTYIDYDYSFLVDETNKEKALQTVHLTNDIDALYYTPFTYSTDNTKDITCKSHLQKIASLLGKRLVTYFDDFTPEMQGEITDTTYDSLISSLFGWGSRVPTMMVNCYLRNDTLYAIQRGKEPHIIDLTNSKRTRPTVNKQLMRTTWKLESVKKMPELGGAGPRAKSYSVEPFTGSVGEDSYSGGHVTSEGFSYRGEYVEERTKQNDDGSSWHTSYTYATSPNGGRFLVSEETTYTDADGNSTTRRTNYHAMGNGYTVADSYEDDEYIGSSTGQGGGASGTVTAKAKDLAQIALGGKTIYSFGTSGAIIWDGETWLVDTTFPVTDIPTLQKLTDAVIWLNRKTKETLTFDLYNYPHIIGFNDRIKIDGKTYYLQSNTATKTPRISNKQTISCVRWY